MRGGCSLRCFLYFTWIDEFQILCKIYVFHRQYIIYISVGEIELLCNVFLVCFEKKTTVSNWFCFLLLLHWYRTNSYRRRTFVFRKGLVCKKACSKAQKLCLLTKTKLENLPSLSRLLMCPTPCIWRKPYILATSFLHINSSQILTSVQSIFSFYFVCFSVHKIMQTEVSYLHHPTAVHYTVRRLQFSMGLYFTGMKVNHTLNKIKNVILYLHMMLEAHRSHCLSTSTSHSMLHAKFLPEDD